MTIGDCFLYPAVHILGSQTLQDTLFPSMSERQCPRIDKVKTPQTPTI